jgi:hypothetical protein
MQENDHKSKIPGEMQRGYQGRGRLRQNSMSSSVLSSTIARAGLRTCCPPSPNTITPDDHRRVDPHPTRSGKPLRPNVLSSLHPLAQSTGYVPSQRQLRDRIVDLAKLNGMTEGVAEGMDDLLGAALDVSLSDCLRDGMV